LTLRLTTFSAFLSNANCAMFSASFLELTVLTLETRGKFIRQLLIEFYRRNGRVIFSND
jgi:hypothetical protein